MLDDEVEQMKTLEEMGKPLGVVNTFTQMDVISLFCSFFGQFHLATSTTNMVMNLICFITYFLNKHVHTPIDLKKLLCETKENLEKLHKKIKSTASSERKKSLSVSARIEVGKYIDSSTFEKAVAYAKDKAADLETQVNIIFSFIYSFVKLYFIYLSFKI
jgi:hypothetical protein